MNRSLSKAMAHRLSYNSFRIQVTCLLGMGWLLAFVGVLAAADAPRVEQAISQAATYKVGDSLAPLRAIEDLVRKAAQQPRLRGPLETGLIQILESAASFEARRFACKQLGVIGSDKALPSLAGMLASEETAGIACLGLSGYPPGKADGVLLKALSESPAAIRVQIINALGDRRVRAAVKELARLADSSETGVAAAAVAALGKIGDSVARNAISKLRGTARAELQPVLIEAALRSAEQLAAAGKKRDAIRAYEELLAPSNPPYVRRGALQSLLALEKDRGGSRILSLLQSGDSTLKPVAIGAIRSVTTPGYAEKFALASGNLPSREENILLLESLAYHRNDTARAALYGALESPDAGVRQAAVTALGWMGDQKSVSPLVRALTASKDSEERRAIEGALASLPGGRASTEAILALLPQCSGVPRGHVISALARRQGTAANPLLFQEAARADKPAAKAAFRALANTVEPSEIGPLLRACSKISDPDLCAEGQAAAKAALGRVPSAENRFSMLQGALAEASNPDERASLLSLLPACACPPAFETLKRALSDSNALVHDAAQEALLEWPDTFAWDALISLYRASENGSSRGRALRALTRLAEQENAHPSESLASRYKELLGGARTENDLRLILGAMGGAADPVVLQLAKAQLGDARVRKEAEVAVRKIAEAIKTKYPEAAREALESLR